MTYRNWLFQRPGRPLTTRQADNSSFELLQSDVNRLFDRFFDDPWLQPATARSNGGASPFTPRVDVVDEKTHLRVTAELPGIDPADVELSVVENALVLKGEKKQQDTREDASGYHYSERSFGAFQRVIPLPEEVDTGPAEATFEKGVLHVRLPKQAPREQKKIPIQVK